MLGDESERINKTKTNREMEMITINPEKDVKMVSKKPPLPLKPQRLRAEPLAVYHSHATEATFVTGIEKSHQFPARFVTGESMQVELRLNLPMAAPQPPQGLARDAGAEK